ncbi:MAG: hypothetical protein GKR89_16390 [Candidatus Latescibacteria bacterium]|nr:hypothetical protein [Candidatus Latescibacterota bacterium]
MKWNCWRWINSNLWRRPVPRRHAARIAVPGRARHRLHRLCYRRTFTPWGLDGGQRAQGAHCWVISPDSNRRELPTKVHAVLHKGNRLLTQPSGGGQGDPQQRDPEAVARDRADELAR